MGKLTFSGIVIGLTLLIGLGGLLDLRKLYFSDSQLRRPEPALSADFLHFLTDIRFTESLEKGSEWELLAKEAKSRNTQGPWELEKVKAQFYSDPSQVTLTGDYAFFDLDKRSLQVEKNVEVITIDGQTIKTERAFYSGPEKKLFTLDEAVVTDQEWGELQGKKMVVELAHRMVTFHEEVHGYVLLGSASRLDLKSDQVFFTQPLRTLDFVGNVQMQSEGRWYQCDKAKFILESNSKKKRKLKKMILEGNVNYQDKSRRVRAQRALVDFELGQTELEGRPVIEEEGRVITGKRIFYDQNQDLLTIEQSSYTQESEVSQ